MTIMSDFIYGSQHSSISAGDSSLHPESNIPSLDSLLKEAAGSAKVYLKDVEEPLAQSSTQIKTNHTQGNTKNFVPLNLLQDSCSLKHSTLTSRERNVLEILQSEIGYQINYFSLDRKTGVNKDSVICKICCETLHIAKAVEHVTNQEHLHNLTERQISKISDISSENQRLKASRKSESLKNTQRIDYNAKSNFVHSSAPGRELNESYSTPVESFNDSDKNVVRYLTVKLKDYINYFEPSETKWNKLCLTCKLCRISFPSKNARLHIYSNPHLHKLRSGLSVAKLEASDARNKKIVKDIINQFNSELYFFQLINDSVLNKLYFICKVCTVVLTPECLESHIYSTEHSKNLLENPVVLNFDSLDDANKQVVRKVTDAIQICRIKDFTFVYRIGTEELHFYCKCCQLILMPENLERHVKNNAHLKFAKIAESNVKTQASEDDVMINSSKTSFNHMQAVLSPSITENFNNGLSNPGTVSNNLFQSYEPNRKFENKAISCKNVKITHPISSVVCHSPPVFSGVRYIPNFNYKSVVSSIEGASKKMSSKTPKSDLSQLTVSNEKTTFVCRDCSSVIHFNTSIFHKELLEKLLINCCGQYTKAVLPVVNSCKTSKRNVVDFKPTLSTTGNICGLESKEIFSSPNPVSNKNLSELEPRNSSDLNKETLKRLIDKIGITVLNFDLVMTKSNELRLKCKFCSVMMRPETVEDHLSDENHVKYSQLSNISSLRFESLNDNCKKIVRKLFNKIGDQISEYDTRVTLGFVCKICDVYVNTKTVANHFESEEHLKHVYDTETNNIAPPNIESSDANFSTAMDLCCCNIL